MDANGNIEKESQSTTYLRYVARPNYPVALFLPKLSGKKNRGRSNRCHLHSADPNSPVYDEALDYQDVKLKIIQQEGYDAHDFNLFDDRASLLWRKPYVDGAVRELTSGSGGRSVEQLRRAVEQLMLAAGNHNPNVRAVQSAAHRSRSNIRLDVDVDEQDALIRDMRRNPEKYQDQ